MSWPTLLVFGPLSWRELSAASCPSVVEGDLVRRSCALSSRLAPRQARSWEAGTCGFLHAQRQRRKPVGCKVSQMLEGPQAEERGQSGPECLFWV